MSEDLKLEESVAKAIFLAEHPEAEWSPGRARSVWFTRAAAAIEAIRSQPHVAQTDSEGDPLESAHMEAQELACYALRLVMDDNGKRSDWAIPNRENADTLYDQAMRYRWASIAKIRSAQPLTPETSDRRSGDADQTSSPSTSSVGTQTPAKQSGITP